MSLEASASKTDGRLGDIVTTASGQVIRSAPSTGQCERCLGIGLRQGVRLVASSERTPPWPVTEVTQSVQPRAPSGSETAVEDTGAYYTCAARPHDHKGEWIACTDRPRSVGPGVPNMNQAEHLLTNASPDLLRRFVDGACSREPVGGLTHTFYRYPARFSPVFVRAAIEAFTRPGDAVLDPFMGGGTTVVEARATGRRCVGFDISSLSVFLAEAKATLTKEPDLDAVSEWVRRLVAKGLNLHRPSPPRTPWADMGYLRNLGGRRTWAIRKTIELALDSSLRMENDAQQRLARAVLLRTAQWALDCRTDVPSASRFRERLLAFAAEMIEGAREYRNAVSQAAPSGRRSERDAMLLVHRSAEHIDQMPEVRDFGPPRLVLTSPPYPGVHVMYHRWQVLGRKETPAPFWIANSLDGNGLSHYTFGARSNPGLKTYFETARTVFASVARVADRSTVFVQMVAFNDASWQLPAYLDAMSEAGLAEIRIPALATADDGRLWRVVPNRKWYATKRGHHGAAREVVLLHQLS